MPNLDEIKARRERVPSPPWHTQKHTADFIANAPTDIDWQVGEVERLRTEVSALTYADEFTYT